MTQPRYSARLLLLTALILQTGLILGWVFYHTLFYAMLFVSVAIAVDVGARYLQSRRHQNLEFQKASNKGTYRSREAPEPPKVSWAPTRLKPQDLVFLLLAAAIFLKEQPTLRTVALSLLLGSMFFLVWKGRPNQDV